MKMASEVISNILKLINVHKSLEHSDVVGNALPSYQSGPWFASQLTRKWEGWFSMLNLNQFFYALFYSCPSITCQI